MTTATQPFSMGSSSITLPAASDCMDMSLEDLIKARRNAISEQKKQPPIKSNTNTNSQAKKNSKKVNAAQKSVGSSKAKRNAKTAARRGITSNSKPDPHALEREVYRQQRRSGANGFGNGGGGDNTAQTRSNGKPRRSTRIRSNKTEAERKTKAKNLANEKKKAKQQKIDNHSNNTKNNNKKNNPGKTQQLTAPPKKAVHAAMKAMNTAGFTAPKGMKMVISFEPSQKKANNNNNKNQNNNTRRGQGGGNHKGKKN